MDLISQVTLLGGVCDRATLVRLRDDKEVDAALRAGTLVRDARGRYSLATTSAARRTANAAAGTLSHRSAALVHGWALKSVPDLPDVTLPRSRKIRPQHRGLFSPHYAELESDDVEGCVTTPRRTLADCLRSLPFAEALAVADSAMRADDTDRQRLTTIAEALRGAGSGQARRVAAHASSAAANPFESALRAIALDVPGLRVTAQLPVRLPGGRVIRPDLGDETLRMAVEAESFEWHGDRRALTRDCVRYNALTLAGWLVGGPVQLGAGHPPARAGPLHPAGGGGRTGRSPLGLRSYA